VNAREAALERDRVARQRLADDPVHQIKQRRPVGGGPANSVEVEAGWNRGDATATTLPPREREVLQLAADGHTNAEIAEQLYKTVHTVKDQMKSVIRRLGARDRPNAVAIGIRRGHIH
jgi:DNA-binding NarL/FixJ family response regulator